MAKKVDGSFSADALFLITLRDGRACAACGCAVYGERGRDWSVHHRKPRGMGGTRNPEIGSPANGVLLCGSGVSGCHGEVERERAKALADGFLISGSGVESPFDVPIKHAVHGWVVLDDDGGFTTVEAP